MNRSVRSVLLVAAATLAFGLASAQERPDAGRNTFLKLCASCHGKSGRGDGPMAPQLRQAPADLTRLAKQHGGVFPSMRVSDSIDGRSAPEVGPHGAREMPVWGTVLRTPAPPGQVKLGNPDHQARRQMVDLLEYLARIQEK
ncbi:MAG: c-type cytochrome [Burkholderiaceae bacterium]